MGNEQSNLSGLEIDEKAIEATDFWIHHSATFTSENSVSVFIGEPLVSGSLWVSQTPLEKAAKNLMVYRHPSILKYISSWHKGSKFYLAVEDVKPLSLILPSQNTLQLCVGLHSVLKALCFLHEKAFVSHNNVCIASIYVTADGNWRIGGTEYLCRFIDLKEDYLSKTRTHRYSKALDVNEHKNRHAELPFVIDCYAFGVLVNEVLNKRSDDNVPLLKSFCELCKSDLQSSEVSKRPKLNSLLEHPFFNHDFINVYSFLTELPLKSYESRVGFFESLTDKLKTFNENIVASQLGGLLLSRMVLLDKTAQQSLIPFLLAPRQDKDHSGLFTIDNFKKHLVPRLLHIFCVRDAQIRLLLLDHFSNFMHCFSNDELQLQILPELLVGIKDTNDHVVSVTLRALADLVPLLGAAKVIGGRRARLFNDGRPIVHPSRRSRRNSPRADSSQDVSLERITISHEELPERPSPDGEEGETSTEDVEESAEGDLDNWEDWDVNEEIITRESASHRADDSLVESISETRSELCSQSTSLKVSCPKKKILPDISELDIKSKVSSEEKYEEYDFFKDMEPVIETSTKYLLGNENDCERSEKKLNLDVADSEKHVEGWGDELDWD